MLSSATANCNHSSPGLKPESSFESPLIHGKPYTLASKIISAYIGFKSRASKLQETELGMNEFVVSPTTIKTGSIVNMGAVTQHLSPSTTLHNTNVVRPATSATVSLNPRSLSESASSIRSKPNTYMTSPVQPKAFVTSSKIDVPANKSLNPEMVAIATPSSSNEVMSDNCKLSHNFKLSKHAIAVANASPITKSSTCTTTMSMSILDLSAINRSIISNLCSEKANCMAFCTSGTNPMEAIGLPIQGDELAPFKQMSAMPPLSGINEFLMKEPALSEQHRVRVITSTADSSMITFFGIKVKNPMTKQGSGSDLVGSSFVNKREIVLNFGEKKNSRTQHKRNLNSFLPLGKPMLAVIFLLILSSVTKADDAVQSDDDQARVPFDTMVCHNVVSFDLLLSI